MKKILFSLILLIPSIIFGVNVDYYYEDLSTGTVTTYTAESMEGQPGNNADTLDNLDSTYFLTHGSGLWNDLDIDTTTLAAGDLLIYSGGNTFTRLPAGTIVGSYLRQDYTWSTPSGSGDMTKAEYDLDDNSAIDLAEGLSSGDYYNDVNVSSSIYANTSGTTNGIASGNYYNDVNVSSCIHADNSAQLGGVDASVYFTTGVAQIIAGTDITISPADGKGDVTINFSGGSFDNLGNHIATTTLTMGNYWINSSSTITCNWLECGNIRPSSHLYLWTMTSGTDQGHVILAPGPNSRIRFYECSSPGVLGNLVYEYRAYWGEHRFYKDVDLQGQDLESVEDIDCETITATYNVTTATFTMTNGASADYVMISNASGDASWSEKAPNAELLDSIDSTDFGRLSQNQVWVASNTFTMFGINFSSATNYSTFSHNASVGLANTPLIFFDDNRTGTSNDYYTEASIVIDAEGAYGMSLVDGLFYITAGAGIVNDGSFTTGDDSSFIFGTGLDFALVWDTNGDEDDQIRFLINGIGSNETGNIWWSTKDLYNYSSGNDYTDVNFTLAAHSGADSYDYSSVTIGPRLTTDITSTWYWDFFCSTGNCFGGTPSATSAELFPIFRFCTNDDTAATSHSISAGSILINKQLEVDEASFFDDNLTVANKLDVGGGIYAQGNDGTYALFVSTSSDGSSNNFIVKNNGNVRTDNSLIIGSQMTDNVSGGVLVIDAYDPNHGIALRTHDDSLTDNRGIIYLNGTNKEIIYSAESVLYNHVFQRYNGAGYSELMRISSNTCVGIGLSNNTNPSEKFEVRGIGSNYVVKFSTSANGVGSFVGVENDGDFVVSGGGANINDKFVVVNGTVQINGRTATTYPVEINGIVNIYSSGKTGLNVVGTPSIQIDHSLQSSSAMRLYFANSGTNNCVIRTGNYASFTTLFDMSRTGYTVFTGSISVSGIINTEPTVRETPDDVKVYSVPISTTLADTEQVELTCMDGHAGWGTIMATDGSKADFTFTSAGVVTLVTDDNADTSDDNDATLNIFDSGTTITIENQLGDTYTLVGEIHWY